MSDIIKQASTLINTPFWKEMFILDTEDIDKILGYRGDKTQSGGGFVPAGRGTLRGNNSNKADVFTPKHPMPELDAHLAKWETLGTKTLALHEFKKLLWLLSLKKAYLENNTPFPEGLDLPMVVTKIKELRETYKDQFEQLNFAVHELQKQVRLGPGMAPGQLAPAPQIQREIHHHTNNYFMGPDALTDDNHLGALFDEHPPEEEEGAVGGLEDYTPGFPIIKGKATGKADKASKKLILSPLSPQKYKSLMQWHPDQDKWPGPDDVNQPGKGLGKKRKKKKKTQSGGNIAKKIKWIPVFSLGKKWIQVV